MSARCGSTVLQDSRLPHGFCVCVNRSYICTIILHPDVRSLKVGLGGKWRVFGRGRPHERKDIVEVPDRWRRPVARIRWVEVYT